MTVQFWQGWPIKRFLKIRNRVKNRVILKLMAIKPPVECFRVTINSYIVYILSTYTTQIVVISKKTNSSLTLSKIKFRSLNVRHAHILPITKDQE